MIAVSDGLLVETQIDDEVDIEGPIGIVTAGLNAIIAGVA